MNLSNMGIVKDSIEDIIKFDKTEYLTESFRQIGSPRSMNDLLGSTFKACSAQKKLTFDKNNQEILTKVELKYVKMPIEKQAES